MGLGHTTPLQQTMTVRQSTEPKNPVEGMTWVDTSGNNTERKMWDGSQWELDVAVGPDQPDHAVEGARWSKTDTDEVRVYAGSSTGWVNIGVTDHGQLDGLSDDDHSQYATDTRVDNHAADASAHHGRPSPGTLISEDANGNFNARDVEGWSLAKTVQDDTTGSLFDTGNVSISTADEVRVRYSVAANAGGTDHIALQLNADTNANYAWRKDDGSTSSGSRVALIESVNANIHGGTLTVQSRPTQTDVTGGYNAKFWHKGGTFDASPTAAHGQHNGNTGISSVRVFMTGGTEGTGNLEIYTRNY